MLPELNESLQESSLGIPEVSPEDVEISPVKHVTKPDRPRDAALLTEIVAGEDVRRATERQDCRTLLDFFEAEALNDAYRETSWDARRYIQMLVSLASDDGADGRLRMAAGEILRRNAMEALKLGGRFQEVTKNAEITDPRTGMKLTVTEKETGLRGIGSRTMKMLEQAVKLDSEGRAIGVVQLASDKVNLVRTEDTIDGTCEGRSDSEEIGQPEECTNDGPVEGGGENTRREGTEAEKTEGGEPRPVSTRSTRKGLCGD